MTRADKISLLHDLHRVLMNPAFEADTDGDLDAALDLVARQIRDAAAAYNEMIGFRVSCTECGGRKGYDPAIHDDIFEYIMIPGQRPIGRRVKGCSCFEDDAVVRLRVKHEQPLTRSTRTEEPTRVKKVDRHAEEMQRKYDQWDRDMKAGSSVGALRNRNEDQLRRLEDAYDEEIQWGHSDPTKKSKRILRRIDNLRSRM